MNAFIYNCLRMPRARADAATGTLAGMAPHALVAQLIGQLELQFPGSRANVEQLVVGCVGQIASQGGNIGLVSKVASGLPVSATAHALNNYCVSGLTAVGQAVASISCGISKLSIAGGVENMSQVSFLADGASYYQDETLPRDGRFLPVPVAADLLATEHDITREELDEIALQSHRRAAAALNSGLNKSLIAVRDERGEELLTHDESIRPDIDPHKLAQMRPAFADFAPPYKNTIGERALEPRHTMAHMPAMVDGAAMALIGPENFGDHTPRARVVAMSERCASAAESLTGGFAAMDAVLGQAGMKLQDVDRIEFMEAFAVVPALFNRRFPDAVEKTNIGGGHIAKGHPMGATGAILLSSLLDSLDHADGALGLVVATGASGIGSAMIVERMS